MKNMITFYLHGGNTRTLSNLNTLFFQNIFETFQKKSKVLCVYFARENTEWEELFKRDTNFIKLSNPEKDIRFTLAEKDTTIFLEQIQDADIIFIKGGHTLWLVDYFSQKINLKKLFEGKIIAGSSA